MKILVIGDSIGLPRLKRNSIEVELLCVFPSARRGSSGHLMQEGFPQLEKMFVEAIASQRRMVEAYTGRQEGRVLL
jgi:hypothetical protein